MQRVWRGHTLHYPEIHPTLCFGSFQTCMSQWEGLQLLWEQRVPPARGNSSSSSPPSQCLEDNEGQNYRGIKNSVPEWRSWNFILHAEALPSSLLALAQTLCHCAGLHTSTQDLLQLLPLPFVSRPFCSSSPSPCAWDSPLLCKDPLSLSNPLSQMSQSEKALSSYSHASLKQLS